MIRSKIIPVDDKTIKSNGMTLKKWKIKLFPDNKTFPKSGNILPPIETDFNPIKTAFIVPPTPLELNYIHINKKL